MKNIFNHTVFLAIIACLLWSSAFVGVKIGLQYHTPLQFAGIRFIISGLMLLPVIRNLRNYLKEVRENIGFVLLVVLLQTVLQYALFYNGVNLVPGSVAAMVVGSSPMFVAVVAHFGMKNDKMSWHKVASIILGIAGVAIISLRKQLPSGAEIALVGVLLLIVNNFVSGLSNVVIARNQSGISPLVLASSSLFFGGLVLFLVSIPMEGMSDFQFPPTYYIALAWLSFLSAAAFGIWNTLLTRPGVKVSNLNIWKFLIPVSGAILSWMIMPDESPDPIAIIGMLVIALALIVLNFSAIQKFAGFSFFKEKK